MGLLAELNMKRERYNITLDPEIHKRGTRYAYKNDNRSFSNFLETLIIEKLDSEKNNSHSNKA